jgi:hypothetical protein
MPTISMARRWHLREAGASCTRTGDFLGAIQALSRLNYI